MALHLRHSVNDVAAIFRSLAIKPSQARKEFPIRKQKGFVASSPRERERIVVSRGPNGIRRFYLDVQALSEVVHLLKKVEHAKTVEYLVCINLAFHSFVSG